MEIFARTEYEVAAAAVRDQTDYRPRVGIVLGSGLSSLADTVEESDIIPYDQIPGWPPSTVVGHQGRLFVGKLEGQIVFLMRGRSHYYEGYPMAQVTLPIRVMQLLGAEMVFLTNAAGGLNSDFRAGDIMLLTDHINFPGMAGANPLRGPNDSVLGPRFPDMGQAYDPHLRRLALSVAEQAGITLHQGVYACVAGPSFETPAEVRLLRAVGADAVGMSTAPEAIVARHGGLRVLGLSGISNVAITEQDGEHKTTHEEVLDAGKVIAPRMETILRGVLRGLPAAD
jgi:purine-nucleoside phosphorylase